MHSDFRRASCCFTVIASLLAAALSAAVTTAKVCADEPAQQTSPSGRLRLYIGTYTGGQSKSQGIYTAILDLSTGAIGEAVLAGEVVSPSFVAIHPSQKFLYSVNEASEFAGKTSGGVSAFSIDRASGKLTLLNQQPSGGDGPCHLTIDQERQGAPHAHSINLDAANKFAIVADLGLDKVLVYRFDGATGKLTPNDPPSVASQAGAGPRHFAFHPSGKFAYVINEMDLTVTAFGYDAQRGVLTPRQTITTLADGVHGHGLSTAEVVVHPSGKFLYGSNRGHNSIVAYTIDPETGKLTYVEHQSTQGSMPRNFFIDPTGTYLLAENHDTNNIVVFKINQQTGEMTPTGHKLDVPMPVCVRALPVE